MACCPLHWTEHEGSCYWFSESVKSWPEADKYCGLESSHLVVINSLEEQVMPGWVLFGRLSGLRERLTCLFLSLEFSTESLSQCG